MGNHFLVDTRNHLLGDDHSFAWHWLKSEYLAKHCLVLKLLTCNMSDISSLNDIKVFCARSAICQNGQYWL